MIFSFAFFASPTLREVLNERKAEGFVFSDRGVFITKKPAVLRAFLSPNKGHV